jgi:hypothetical protein
MICQIRILNLPTCRTAMRRKTAARMMTAMYVDYCLECRVIGIGIKNPFNFQPVGRGSPALALRSVIGIQLMISLKAGKSEFSNTLRIKPPS